jgi:hypothetical protein
LVIRLSSSRTRTDRWRRATGILAFVSAVALAAVALGTDTARADERVFSAGLEPSASFVSPKAQGRADFWLSSTDAEINYEITGEKIKSVTQIHIHLDPKVVTRGSGLNLFQVPTNKHGPIVAFLMDFNPNGVTNDGMLAKGVIRESDLVGPLRARPLSLLIELMENADTYVAVHVLKPVPPSETFCCPVGLRGVIHEKKP